MREPPRLSEAAIEEALYADYGMSIMALRFLALGNDMASFVYRVDARDGTAYFLKVRAGHGFSAPSLTIPRFLYKQGIPHILPPVPTTKGALWVQVQTFALTLYPFIDAPTAADVGLSNQHWHALGAALQRIHTTQLAAELQQIMPRETFVPSRRHVLDDVEAVISGNTIADPIQRELAAFWRSRSARLRELAHAADTLGKQLRHAALPLVLCHADLHAWNILRDVHDQMWIVDWDETVLAPKERDLMFIVGGIGRDLVGSHETMCCLQGYGDGAIDGDALTYYRYAWAVQDLAAYAEQVFFDPDFSEQSRYDALKGFVDLFAPGNIVDIACAATSGMA